MADLLVKVLLFLIFGPVLICIGLQLLVGIIVAALPWLILLAVITGIVAGLSAGLVVRPRLLPPGQGSPLPPGSSPLGPWRIRRPSGRRTWR